MKMKFIHQSAAVVLLTPVVVLAASATETWSTFYSGAGGRDDLVADIAVGSDGSVYVAGTSEDSSNKSNLMLLKYAPDSQLLWDTILDGTEAVFDRPWSIALDSQDNIVLFGVVRQPGGGALDTVWKIEPETGTVLWDHTIPGTLNCFVFGGCRAALAVTPNDEVIIGGWQFVIEKLSPNGNVLWTRSVQPSPSIDMMNDIAVASDGRILCGGISSSVFDGSGVVAYDASGTFLWSDQQLGSHGAVFGTPHVGFDELGNAIAAYSPETSCGLFGVLLAKYDPAGSLQWTKTYHQNPCQSFEWAEMVVANSDEIYVAGSLGGSADINVVKFDSNGNVAWDRSYDGPLGSTDIGTDIALDALGNVYVSGTELATGSQDRDMAVVSYDSAGNFLWNKSFDGSATTNDTGRAVAVSGCGRVYLAGWGWHAPNLQDVFLVAYDQPLPGDYDNDFDVDLADFAAFQGGLGFPFDGMSEQNDLNGNGIVDLADLIALSQCATGPLP